MRQHPPSISVAWQDLPEKWLRPVIEGALSVSEAIELRELLRPGQWVTPPEHLQQAVSRLLLLQEAASPTLH